jgi:hypothetical protein
VRRRDREIVNVDLAALLLELPELVGRDAADDFAILQSHQRDERLAGEQRPQVARAGPLRRIRLDFIEDFTEGREQSLHQRDIVGREVANIHRHRISLSTWEHRHLRPQPVGG